jgi:hypothetical protein
MSNLYREPSKDASYQVSIEAYMCQSINLRIGTMYASVTF